MQLSFNAKGHENISCGHKKTFEFTKENFVTKNGDCIAGIDSDFSIPINFLDNSRIMIEIEAEGYKETIVADLNSEFSSKKEMVVRKSDFISDRTFAFRADKASSDFNDGLKEKLKNPETHINIKVKKIE